MESAIEVYLTAPASGGSLSIVSLILDAGLIVQLVLFGLVMMSLICWAIIFQKFFRLRSASRQSAKFLELFWASKRLDAVYEGCGRFRSSPVAEVFKAGYQELAKATKGGKNDDATDNLTRTLRRASAAESTNLEKYITFLATTGSTAPFIGLFGTVWGIMQAFAKLQDAGTATIQVVGPDIAHALIATAIGLAAAIPAVMAYNYFNSRIRVLNDEMSNFSSDFLNIVKRHFGAR